MQPLYLFSRSITVVNPRVRRLVQDLETMLEQLRNPTTSNVLIQMFKGYLSAQQIEQLLCYQLQLIVPDDPSAANIQAELANLQFNDDLVFNKNFGLTRTSIFLNDAQNNLVSGVFTLSKDEYGNKPPLEQRILNVGSMKNRKNYILISKVTHKVIVMARLHVTLGFVKDINNDFLTELHDVDCPWRNIYRHIEHEMHIIQLHNSPLVDRPRLGRPYIKDNWIMPCWVINIHDECAEYSLYDFITALRNPKDKISKLTSIEQAVYFSQVTAGLTPTLVQKFMHDMLHAVKMLHDNNFIHRDIKPDNMLLMRAPNGSLQLKLSDFGATINTIQSQGYITELAYLVGITIPVNNFVWIVPYIREEIYSVRNIPIFAAILNNPQLNRAQKLEQIIILMHTYINEYANSPGSNPYLVAIMLSKTSVTKALRARLALLRSKFYPNNTTEFKEFSAEPYATFIYASPEVIKYNLEHSFAKHHKYYKSSVEMQKQQGRKSFGMRDYTNSPEVISQHHNPEKSHDVYALGICIFELLTSNLHEVFITQFEDQILNRYWFLKPMLEANADKRCTIDQAIEHWKIWQAQVNVPVITPKTNQFVGVPNTPPQKQQSRVELSTPRDNKKVRFIY